MAIGILGIVSFIGVILILIGVILFFIGRKEFGEKHQNNVKNAIIIFIINIVVATILTSAIVFFAISSITTSTIANSSPEINMGPLSILIVIISIVSAILGGLMYYFALIELEDEQGKNILYAAIISSIGITTVTSVYIAGLLGEMFGSISSTSSYSSLSFIQNTGGIGILGVIPNLLFLYAFYIPYKRIKDGELIPQVSSSVNSTAPGRICPNCSRSIPMDANTCPYCGKKFESYL
ncbi:unnamed protein product [marine sediment metagenome]|uniref:UPF0547 domain-containing protein n=1 Tax=marine sediment metagenome TaxID=412755 RepID=X1SEJ6_9ZZZZ